LRRSDTEIVEEESTKPQVSLLTGEPYGPRVRFISEKAEEESSDDESESESEYETTYLRKEEVPSVFWHIQKLIKYMKAGNQTATMISLCLLKDYDLDDKVDPNKINNRIICCCAR